MHIHLAAIGRFGSGRHGGPERALFDHYATRVIPPIQLKELEDKRTASVAERRRREADLLLGAVPRGGYLVALDETGRTLDSQAFASRLETLRDRGIRDLVFAIGGADGLHESVRDTADFALSLGPMTWPHLLVRGLIAEQIFRAQSILAGHPYHRA